KNYASRCANRLSAIRGPSPPTSKPPSAPCGASGAANRLAQPKHRMYMRCSVGARFTLAFPMNCTETNHPPLHRFAAVFPHYRTTFMPFDPDPKLKFTFGLWTVGNVGRDPFGEPTRERINVSQICKLLGDAGAYGVNF